MDLLTPVRLGPLTVRNRVVMTAHGAFLEFYRPGEPPRRYLDYLGRRADGGTGLIILQPVHVHRSSSAAGHFTYDPDDLFSKLQLMAGRLHGAGAHALIQLFHFGAQFTSDARRGLEPLWAFSPLVSPEGEVAHEMNEAEIEAVIEGFASTAAIAVSAGLDGVELHATHGYLLQQSFSPWGNQRHDRWGEPLAFMREVMRRVRERIGNRKVMGLRISVDDFVAPARGGLGPDALRAIAVELVRTGLVDYVNHSEGARSAHYARAIGTWRRPHGEFLPLAKALRQGLDGAVPVIGAGRVVTVAEAEAALREGVCDLVAMTRAQIADPDVVRKASRAQVDQIRLCVGANQGCVDRMAGGLPITCFHNPDVGREGEVAIAAPARGRLLVVGAGPAGLKAAEVASRRGYEVVVAERAARVGGRLLAVERLGPASELLHAIDWLAAELARRGVDVRTGTVVTPDDLDGYDAVVIATGSAFAGGDHVPQGDGTVPIVSTDAAVSERAAFGRILVFDALGTLENALVASHLAGRGSHVVIATPGPQPHWACGFTHVKDLLTELGRAGVQTLASTVVADVANGAITTRHLYTGERRTFAVDALVAGVARRADDALAAAARARGLRVAVAGDAVAPRTALHAFREGDDAGRTI